MVLSTGLKNHAPLSTVLGKIEDISTLPHTLLRIFSVTNDPLSNAEDLRRVIESDPPLCARVLQCANSTLHGLRHRIDTPTHAICYLGFTRVRNLAVTATVCELFRNDATIGRYNRRSLWNHMVAVAITAREIAETLHISGPDEVFLAGLLHDIGIILEDQYLHEPFSDLMRHYPTGRTLCQAEQAQFGFDHTLLGSTVAQKWNLPELVWKTIRLHHAPRYNGPMAPVIACVELANVMCTSKGIGSVGVPLPGMSPSVLDHLRIKKSDIKMLIEDMNKQIDEHAELFELVSNEARQRLTSA